jgi:riboflavin kinase/FMN adenylyltransferase
LGIDDVRVVSFTEELAHESAASFVSRILVDECAASCVVVGEDFRFGHSREGDVSFLRRAGRSHSFDVVALAPLGDENRWSSTAVRTCVAAGEMESAAAMLGRPFVLRATVVPGDQRGRELGYPTANMAVVPSRLIPADGVYAGATRLNGEWVPAAVSIGTRPQFYDNGDLLVEVHLPGFSGDLYGHELDTAFLRRLRGMAKFESLEELLARMAVDVAETEAEFRNFRPSAYELLT